jgi:hypothetical protein
MRISPAAILLPVLPCLAQAPAGQGAEIEKAAKQALELGRATIAGDFAKVIDSSHPKLVELMGGRTKAIEFSKSAIDGMKAGGYDFTDYSVNPVSQVVRKGQRIYAVFPTRLVMKTPKGKAISVGFLLAVSENKGDTWTFLDGAGFQDPQIQAAVIPDLPAEIILPKIAPPTFSD